MQLVIVPAWRRADFLLAALRRIEIAAREAGELVLWLCLDRGASHEVNALAAQYAARPGVRVRTIDHPYRGNSFNILTAYFEACTLAPAPELVHLIEEDIFVGADYFAFHAAAHQLCPDVLAVSACRNQNLEPPPDGPSDAIFTHRSYQSLAVSFKPAQLERVLLHVRPEYFYDPVGYCRALFPDYSHGAAFAEQDGLIRRVGELAGLDVAYPFAPRAYHAGFHGYNRPGAKLEAAPLEARAARLLAMTSEELNARARSIPDHVAINLDAERPALRLAMSAA